MKRRMALLLVFAMIVTTSITVPFVSFAASTSTTVTIDKLFATEKTFENTNPKIEGNVATSTFKYKPDWDIKAKFVAGTVADAINTTLTIKAADDTEPTKAAENSTYYNLVKGVTYTITTSYEFAAAEASETPAEIELSKTELVANAYYTTLTSGSTVNKTIHNTELWYSINPTKKGMIFSLQSGADGAKITDKVNYALEVYDNQTKLGKAGWNAEYKSMFECPLILKPGTNYYVRLVPTASAQEDISLKFNTVAEDAAGLDEAQDTTIAFNPGEEVHKLTLYAFQNKISGGKASGYWYKINPQIASNTEGRFVVSASIDGEQYGDATIILFDPLSPEDAESVIAYAGGDNTFYKDLVGDRAYYLKIIPGTDVPKVSIDLTFKKHECEDAWFLSDDEETIIHGCRCGSEESWKASGIINTTKTKFADVTYTGEPLAIAPTFIFKERESVDGKKPIIDPSCYTLTVKNSSGNTVTDISKLGIGTYTVTIKFVKSTDPNSTSSLKGLPQIKNKKFKVVPVGTELTQLVPAKKAMTVKWNKSNIKITGYEIQYSTSSKFKNAKTVTVAKSGAESKKISKLTAKKKYYVRIRTYKTVKKTKYYSKWSTAMNAKTK